MSRLHRPDPVKPVFSVFSADRQELVRVAHLLEDLVGPFDYASAELAFDRTDYYRAEMGWPLIRRFFSAEHLIDPSELVEIKVRGNDLESRLAVGGQRTVNIDPGYISPERLVLATGKNYIHRVYLDRGVWADLTLIFQAGRYQPLPWTYPDYATEEVREILLDIRKKCLEQLRGLKQETP